MNPPSPPNHFALATGAEQGGAHFTDNGHVNHQSRMWHDFGVFTLRPVVLSLSFSIAMVLFFCFEGFQIFIEPIEVSFPLDPTVIDPLFGHAEHRRLEPAGTHPPDLFRANKTRVLKHRQVLHHGR